MSFHADFSTVRLPHKGEEDFSIKLTSCPDCGRSTIFLVKLIPGDPLSGLSPLIEEIQIWPKGVARSPLPPEVPEKFATDYREACLILNDSPKASAALSRRCLQNLLRDKAGVKPSDLSKEIDELLASKTLPSDLADTVDAIRNIGNFAAHPLKSTDTGLIVEVEPGEAEWCLDVLEELFDFYFVRPGRIASKRDALNKKLAEAGKPPMKCNKS